MKPILFRVKEEIINGINYRLNGWTKTAEVIKKSRGYEGDIVIPEAVVFNERTYRVTSIGKKAFAFCYPLTSITIPDSVKSIGWNAFLDCEPLKEICIPNSVTSIGSHAFDGCDSLLSFTYQGTLAQWKKIKLGYFWKTPIPIAVLHCTDGDVKV
jgi:hypothetical protein